MRLPAQQQRAEADTSLEDETNCAIHVHTKHYIGKNPLRKTFFHKNSQKDSGEQTAADRRLCLSDLFGPVLDVQFITCHFHDGSQ